MNSKLLHKFSGVMLLMLFWSLFGFAQERKVTGKVVDQTDGSPLPGVNVSIKGRPSNVSTNAEGVFTISVPTDDQTLIFSFIGYARQQVSVAGKSTINVSLVTDNQTLKEVNIVQVGYGTLLKSKVLGSISEIKGAEVEDLPVANLGTALMNRVAGVGISVASGKPGATTSLTLQGAYSASSTGGITTDPLYVIDGLIAQKSDFDNLDASLVESISFLKDAQAAIYGAAADKGVVLVTTKKGKIGKPQISYTGYFGTSDAIERPKLMTGIQLAQTVNDALTLNNAQLSSRFSQADLDYIASNPVPSWYSQLWHTSQTQRHTINISGGTDKITFFGGGSYYDEGGNFGVTKIKKYNIRAGITAKITDDVTAYISLNTNYSNDFRNTAKSENSDTENYTYSAINQVQPWVPLTINGLPNYWVGPSSIGGAFNPLAYFNSNSYTTNATQAINLNSSLEYHPHQIKGLTARVQFGKNNYQSTGKNYYPSYQTYQFASTGQNGSLYSTTLSSVKTISNSNQILASTSTTSEYELIGSLNYNHAFKSHNLDLLFVATQNETNSTAYNIYRTTQQIPGVDQFFAFDPSTTTAQNITNAEGGNLGYVGRINYDYKGKYLLQLIDRIDGSSNFAPGKRFGSSPAAAIGWRVSEEDFFKKYLSKYINSLKIRYNIGITGDDRVAGFLYKSRFTSYSGTALFGTTITNGLTPSVLANPNITWEHNRAQTFGVDATFFNDKLSVTAEIWNKHYYDGLVDLSAQSIYPGTFGALNAAVNYNKANTWGETFTIGYATQINRNWGVNANINFGWGNNQLTQAYYNPASLGAANEYQLITIGELANTYNSTNYGLIAKGIIRTQAQLDAILAKNPNYTIDGKVPQVGWMDYVDRNGDGKITTTADEGPMYKRTNPIFASGITLGASYKSFRLSVNSYLQLGGKVTINDRTPPTSASSNSSGGLNEPFFWADHWTPSNPNAKYPRTDAALISENSTFWIRSGTRLYINNATLSYSLPKAFANRLRIPSLRLLVTGQNLWSIINPFNYKDIRQNSITSYPTLRTFSLGVNLTL